MLGNILILGDSYSTHKDWIPDGYDTYYSNEGVDDPRFTVKKMNAEDTWWMRLINSTGSNLVLNNSWSGSPLCYTGWNLVDCSKTSSFIYRYRQLKEKGFFEKNKIDTLFVFGGTNDSWCNAPIGELKYSDFSEDELFSVLPAICYFMKTLKEDLLTTRIVFIANCDIKDELVNGIKIAGEHFGVETIALSGICKEWGHPNTKGMEEICEQVLSAIQK